jgi:hypothetical protein
MTKIIYIGEQPKAIAKQLKPIEFVSKINSSTLLTAEASLIPSQWEHVELVTKNYSEKHNIDIMLAYDSDENGNKMLQTLYLGHWNDGVKEVPKLKPIEFKFMVEPRGQALAVSASHPKNFDIIEVISIHPRAGFDKFYCYSEGERNEGAMFLGHLNDGVV